MRWKAVTYADNMLGEDNFDRCLFFSFPSCFFLIAALTMCQGLLFLGLLFLRLLSDSVPGGIISEVLVKDGCFTEEKCSCCWERRNISRKEASLYEGRIGFRLA